MRLSIPVATWRRPRAQSHRARVGVSRSKCCEATSPVDPFLSCTLPAGHATSHERTVNGMSIARWPKSHEEARVATSLRHRDRGPERADGRR